VAGRRISTSHLTVTDWHLKYGLNPHQGDAVARFPDGQAWLRVLNGEVGYINLLDATRAWTLARELATTLGAPSAASIKHVHPAGAAVSRPLDHAGPEPCGHRRAVVRARSGWHGPYAGGVHSRSSAGHHR
jgi:AICAR transformylase/IMP cyclohydrolase PurH